MVVAAVTLSDIASTATALGLVAIAYQLVLARAQLRTSFEQTFASRYQTITARLPLPLLLGESTDLDPVSERALYDYFELCEEELYFRRSGRISSRTWREWWEGIVLNFHRPGIRAGWNQLKDRAVLSGVGTRRMEQFDLLREAVQAIDTAQDHDPRRTA